MTEAEKFVNSIKNDALKYQNKSGIPYGIIIAQACLETGYGRHICKDINTGKDSKNLFNIKGTANNGSVLVWTTEYYKGVKTKVKANFRAYKTYEDSFSDHAKLLLTNRYKPCMAVKNDPIKFAHKLQEVGYATDPKYPEKLIYIMKKFNLMKGYTAMDKMKDEIKRTLTVTLNRINSNLPIQSQIDWLNKKYAEYKKLGGK